MKTYINEAEECPFCKSDNIDSVFADGLGVTDTVQFQFECGECGSTWDVIFSAKFTLNEWNAKAVTTDE